MTMHTTNASLDGATNGIAAFIRSRNGYLKRSDGSILFPNFRSLEARLFRDSIDYHDVALSFIIIDKVVGKAVISFNDAIKTDNGWKVARYESIYGNTFLHVYNITECSSDEVTNIGYIVTKESGKHDANKDPKFEYKKLKTIRTMAWETAAKMCNFQCYGGSLHRTKQGFEVKLDNTSAVIHVWANSKLMDYNTNVKKARELDGNQDRCLPFTPGMDKYGTLYIFATCEEFDYNDSFTRQAIDRFEEEFMLYINDLYPDMNAVYKPCQFAGKVIYVSKKNEEV